MLGCPAHKVTMRERRVEGTSSSVLEVEASLLPRARELHQQLEAHLRGLGLPPVSLEPAPPTVGNGSSGSQEAGGEWQHDGHHVKSESNGSGNDRDLAGSHASLERIQQHINSSSGSRVTAPVAGQGAAPTVVQPSSWGGDANDGAVAGSGTQDSSRRDAA